MPSIAVVGGGFGGVAAIVMLRRAGFADVTVFERGERIGGVWNHNTYPGAACDVPSHMYEFSFAPNPGGHGGTPPRPRFRPTSRTSSTERASRGRVRTGVEVQSATGTRSGRSGRLRRATAASRPTSLLTACGQLSVPSVPAIPGLDDFAGPAFHTAQWRHDVPLDGRRVAMVGTGCSAIQAGPAIAPSVAPARHLPALARMDVSADGLRLHGPDEAAARALPGAAASRPSGQLRVSRTRRGGDDGPEPVAAAGLPRDRSPADQQGDRGSGAPRRR